MKIALVSDAWTPQVNGVVRTLTTTVEALRAQGHEVLTITPDLFANVPCPGYAEIRLALMPGGSVARMLRDFAPDAIHIATEGPLGWVARRWCLRGDRRFTTSFHTRFPDYLALRTHLPASWFWAVLRRFHRPAAATFAATAALEDELAARGFSGLHRWSRGADLSLFSPEGGIHPAFKALPRPIALHVGRVAPEKNIAAFLDAPFAGTKVVVGDGPSRTALKTRYSDAVFLGALHGEDLAAAYRGADLLAFPSLTDTFGLVMIEALASGTPVAAYPAPAPMMVIGDSGAGVLAEDLGDAMAGALRVDRARCRAHARQYSWDHSTGQFLSGLVSARA